VSTKWQESSLRSGSELKPRARKGIAYPLFGD
jgi:hypothetical protein